MFDDGGARQDVESPPAPQVGQVFTATQKRNRTINRTKLRRGGGPGGHQLSGCAHSFHTLTVARASHKVFKPL